MIWRGAASVLNEAVVSYMLGDSGAEVIRVKPPITGDSRRGFEPLFDDEATSRVNMV